jgi:hypothetical protein
MMSDPEKANQKAMMDMVAGDVDFTSEDLVEHLQKQAILARELKGVRPEKFKEYEGVEANEMTTGNSKAVGICYDYQSEGGCLRKNCRYRHEELSEKEFPTNDKTDARPKQNVRKAPAKRVTVIGKCKRCAKEGHPGEECPERKSLKCAYCGKKGHCAEACQTNPDNEKLSPSPETKKGGGEGETRGRGERRGSGGQKKPSMAHAVVTEYDDDTDESTSDDGKHDGGEWEYRGTMVLQSNNNARSNTLPKEKQDEVRLLIDSGCDTLALKHRRDGFDWRSAKMVVNEATEERTTLVGCEGKVELELPMGGILAVSDAIYSKNFRHNLCGTSTLGKAGISTLMHEGKVFLIDAKSMGQLPKTWKVRACEGVDRDTGLPFIVMKRQLPKKADTVLEKEARQKREETTRVKQRNASWRSRQEAPTPIYSAKSYPERKVSRKGGAVGEEEFLARARNPPKEKEMKRQKGQERPKETNGIWRSRQDISNPTYLAKSCPDRKESRGNSAMGGGNFRARSKMREEEEMKRLKGGERPKEINAIWRSHQEDPNPIYLAKRYPERGVSPGNSAMGGEEFRARSRKLREEKELKEFKKGQEQQKEFRKQGRKIGNLPWEKGAQSADNALSGKMVATKMLMGKLHANPTGGYSINTAVKKTLMSGKLRWCLGNSSGNGRTRLPVPPRFSC